MPNKTTWNLLEKLVFRFSFILFPLFMCINFLELHFFQVIIPWLAKNVWSIENEVTYHVSGSGDTLYNYVFVLSIAAISVIGCLVWTVIERNKQHYNELNYWLTSLIRYFIALVLFQYGMFKIIKVQFPFPGLETLSMTYGNTSPMRLAWTFFGFSKGYNYFVGIAEILPLLLLYRRTVTLGAFMAFATSINIMAINYFYDVPVKILSTALVIMSLYLLAPNLKQLWGFFVQNKPAQLRILSSNKPTKVWVKYCLIAIKTLFIGAIMITSVIEVTKLDQIHGSSAPKAPLYGIYNVETFVLNRDTLPPLITDSMRWRQLIINWPKNAYIKSMDEKGDYYMFDADTVKKTIRMEYKGTQFLKYDRPDANHLSLTGKLNSNSIYMYLTRQDETSFPLVSRGFHWISEDPYNH